MDDPVDTRPASRSAIRRQTDRPLRLAIRLTLVAAVVLAAVYWQVGSGRRALLGAQQACLEYEAPRDAVVYEEHPARAAALLNSSSAFEAFRAGGPGGPPVTGHVPPAWRALRRWALPDAPEPTGAVLFLHERHTASGTRGVVCVEADRAGRQLRVTFIHPGSSKLDPSPVRDLDVRLPPQEGLIVLSGGGDPFASKLPPDDPPDVRADLRFFAGWFDPDDKTYFLLPYERDGRRGIMQMWLPDEQTVHFADRVYADTQPVTQPAGPAQRP